jgi:hypothetical protein
VSQREYKGALEPVFDEDKRQGVIAYNNPSPPPPPPIICPVSDSLTWPTTGFVRDIAISGNHAFALVGNSLVSINISDPTNLTIVDTLANVGGELSSPNAITISGTVAYVVGSGIATFDISNPASLALMDYLFLAATTNGVAVSGNHAFICLASDFVSSINVSNPNSLSYVTDISTGINDPRGIAISGTVAYVANTANDSLTSINIANPASLAFLDDIVLATDLNEAWDVKVSGAFAYVTSAVATNGWVTAIDISNPAALAYNDSLTETIFQTNRQLILDGTNIYVVSFASDTVSRLDNSTPGSPLLSASLTDALFDQATSLTKSGNYLLVGGGASGGTAWFRSVHISCFGP